MSQSDVQILNDSFKIVSYNGGAIYGSMGVAKVLSLKPAEEGGDDDYFSKKGRGFDLLLEYTGEAGAFSLTHLVVQAVSQGTSALKTLGAWVHAGADVPALSYSDKFQCDLAVYNSTPASMRPTPAPTALMACKKRGATGFAVEKVVSGKYLHLKFIDAHGSGSNIDVNKIVIVGTHGANGNPAAVMDAAAAPAAAASSQAQLAAVDWGAMFNAAAPAAPVLAAADKAMLIEIGALPAPFSSTSVNAFAEVHSDYLAQGAAVVLLSNTPVAAAKAAVASGNATAAQTAVVAQLSGLEAVAQSTGKRSPLSFFYCDTTCESRIAYGVACMLSLPYTHIPVTKGGKYNFLLPSGADFAVIAYAQNEKFHFAAQDKAACTAAGNKTAKGAENKTTAALTAALANLKLAGTPAAAGATTEGIALAGFCSLFDRYVTKGDAGALVRHYASEFGAAGAPNGILATAFPTVQRVTRDTFTSVVVDSEGPVLVVSCGDETAAIARSAILLAAAATKAYTPATLTVALVDTNTNDLDEELFEGNFAVRLFTKAPAQEKKADAAAKGKKKATFEVQHPDQQRVVLTNAAGLKVTQFGMPLKAAGSKGGDEHDDEDEDEDEDGMPEEDDEDGHGKQYEAPAPSAIAAWVATHAPNALPVVGSDDAFTAAIETADSAASLGRPSDYKSVTAMLQARGIAPGCAYAAKAGSEAAVGMAALIEAINSASAFSEKLPEPVGTAADLPGATYTGATGYALVEAMAAQAVGFAATNAPVTLFAQAVEQARISAFILSRYVKYYPALFAAEAKDNAEALIARVTAAVGVVARHSSTEPAVKAPTGVVGSVDAAALAEDTAAITAILTELRPLLAEEAAKQNQATGFAKAVPVLPSMDAFMRVLVGLPPVAAKAKMVRGKPVKEKPCENAEERLVVVLITAPWDDHNAYKTQLVQLAAHYAAESEANGEPAPSVVFYNLPASVAEVMPGLAPEAANLPQVRLFSGADEMAEHAMPAASFADIADLLELLTDVSGMGAGEEEGEDGWFGEEEGEDGAFGDFEGDDEDAELD